MTAFRHADDPGVVNGLTRCDARSVGVSEAVSGRRAGATPLLVGFDMWGSWFVSFRDC